MAGRRSERFPFRYRGIKQIRGKVKAWGRFRRTGKFWCYHGGPNYATQTLPIMIYRYSMKKFNVGAASALSTMMFAVICFLSGLMSGSVKG